MPLPHNLFDYCSIRKSNFIEKYLVVKRKISFVYKADILLTKLIIRGGDFMNLLVEVSIYMFFIAILATAFVIFILPFLMHVSLLIIKFLLTVVYIIRTVILWLCRLFTH